MGWKQKISSLTKTIYWYTYRNSIRSMCQVIVNAFGDVEGYEGKNFFIRYYSWFSVWVIEYRGTRVAHYTRERGQGWIVLKKGDWFFDFIKLYQRAKDKNFGNAED